MTIVNSLLAADKVLVMSDTLIGGSAGGVLGFADKVHTLAHLGILIAGRGVSNIPDAWARIAGFNDPGSDIDSLVEEAPSILKACYGRYDQAEMDAAGCRSTVVYMWGWSTAAERFLGYQFDSRSAFAAETVSDGLTVAPGLEEPMSEVFGMEGLQAIALAQHAQDRRNGEDQIGGVFMQHQLTRVSGQTNIAIAPLMSLPTLDADTADAQDNHPFRTRHHLAVVRALGQ